jgi:hypothetical protein
MERNQMMVEVSLMIRIHMKPVAMKAFWIGV